MTIELLEAVDGYAGLRNALRRIAGRDNEWAGIPMPLEGFDLEIEPKFPNAEILATLTRGINPPAEPAPPLTDQERGRNWRNAFWSTHLRSTVHVFDEDDPADPAPAGQKRRRVSYGVQPGVHHLNKQLATLGASVAWGIEQEGRAVQLLGTLLRHHAFKHYLLTGMFLETSPRSHITYLFRRLRPTVALDLKGKTARVMCALCLHPIAYYSGSWAGAMCPTDDVVAHLMLMRGDEKMFWRRANQHPAWRPEAGL